jgi:hypothetical protein
MEACPAHQAVKSNRCFSPSTRRSPVHANDAGPDGHVSGEHSAPPIDDSLFAANDDETWVGHDRFQLLAEPTCAEQRTGIIEISRDVTVISEATT